MPQKRWRIDGNFVATPEEFLLQGNPTKQTTHCALVHFYGENDPVLLVRMITMLQSSIGKLFELNVHCPAIQHIGRFLPSQCPNIFSVTPQCLLLCSLIHDMNFIENGCLEKFGKEAFELSPVSS